jgi:uncharacterized protein (UPF0335 family)
MAGLGNNSNAQLKSIVERIENVEAEIKERRDDLKDIYAEAKSNGFDAKALRVIVRRRKQDAAKLKEHEQIVETYMLNLGMLADLPLGKSAIERATATA